MSELEKYNDYWYLREGDFMPEKAQSLFGGTGITTPARLDMLADAGNIFATLEEAQEAYEAVVRTLSALRACQSECKSTSTPARIRQSRLASACRMLQNAAEQTLSLLPLLQEHIQETCGGQAHAPSGETPREKYQT